MTVAVGGVTCEIKGTGTVRMIFRSEGESENADFKNVLYSPKLQKNLISGSLINKAGSHFIGKKGQVNVYDKDVLKVSTAK
ncbi:uncharacterized protein TNIN_228681 [Trichonephila inaurata madagascariensis]|uniref:Retrovirus-related Pol polyprotein from transposon TNT 1-94-like beta-barrel domain-containing protein n=1 Tax=Trichonephila inaurata madagascariensis TaxID=2747483 RepID=A0A8X7CLX1_9ARAC|nr:uncharacterized protein TNIN_228681 [Trichonephila inaurata madagascariensis]